MYKIDIKGHFRVTNTENYIIYIWNNQTNAKSAWTSCQCWKKNYIFLEKYSSTAILPIWLYWRQNFILFVIYPKYTLSSILPHVLPHLPPFQYFYFTQICLPYLWHFATLPGILLQVWKRLDKFITLIGKGISGCIINDIWIFEGLVLLKKILLIKLNWIDWNWIPPILQRYAISIGSTVPHPASWRDIWRGWKRRDWSGWVSNIRLHLYGKSTIFKWWYISLQVRMLSIITGSYLIFWGPLFVVTVWHWSWGWEEAKKSLAHEVDLGVAQIFLQRFERNTFPCLWCASNTVDISLIPRSASTYPTFTPLSIPRSTW